MKIGLFGGTFDPPHLGHIQLALDFYKASDVDLLIVMPSFIPPHKASSSTDVETRLQMTKIACLKLGELGVNYTVSDFEINKQDTSYTINTVNFLLGKYGIDKISLCVGSDMLLSFESWKSADELMKKCHIYSKEREVGEYDELSRFAMYLKEKYSAEVTVMNGNTIEVSSTELRLGDKNVQTLLDPSVARFIKNNGLYTNS